MESVLRASRVAGEFGFEVVTRDETAELEAETGRIKVDTVETRSALRYESAEPKLTLVDRKTTTSSHWEEPGS